MSLLNDLREKKPIKDAVVTVKMYQKDKEAVVNFCKKHNIGVGVLFRQGVAFAMETIEKEGSHS